VTVRDPEVRQSGDWAPRSARGRIHSFRRSGTNLRILREDEPGISTRHAQRLQDGPACEQPTRVAVLDAPQRAARDTGSRGQLFGREIQRLAVLANPIRTTRSVRTPLRLRHGVSWSRSMARRATSVSDHARRGQIRNRTAIRRGNRPDRLVCSTPAVRSSAYKAEGSCAYLDEAVRTISRRPFADSFRNDWGIDPRSGSEGGER
jgi:hypothetical protein